MSDDLKERMQKHDWRHLTARIEQLEAEKAELHLIYYKEFERAKVLGVLHGNEVNRSMELEAKVDTLQTAMTAPTQDEIDLRSKLASSQAEALAAHAEVIRTQDEIGKLLHHAEAQLAAAREALDVFLRHCRTDMSRKAQDALNAVRAALATAPATDGEKT